MAKRERETGQLGLGMTGALTGGCPVRSRGRGLKLAEPVAWWRSLARSKAPACQAGEREFKSPRHRQGRIAQWESATVTG